MEESGWQDTLQDVADMHPPPIPLRLALCSTEQLDTDNDTPAH